jgi:hypothetical protein
MPTQPMIAVGGKSWGFARLFRPLGVNLGSAGRNPWDYAIQRVSGAAFLPIVNSEWPMI